MIGIAGIGQTEFGRHSGRSLQSLVAEASRSAIADAGLRPGQIDGVIPVGGYIHVEDVLASAALPLQAADAMPTPGGNAAVDSLRLGSALIASGQASNVLIVLAKNGSSANRIDDRIKLLPGQQFRTQLEWPQGWSAPVEWYAMICRRHMVDFGTTKDQLADVSLAAYSFAQRNPRAMQYGKPLTREKYHAARMIADPYQLYDCCLETDGAAAVVLSAGNGGADPGRLVEMLAVVSGRPQSPDELSNRPDWYEIGLSYAAPAAYELASVGPGDMDGAMIYDCFTFEVLHQLEVAGFCEKGKGGPFAASGAIGPGGSLPVNTHGGLLAEGHMTGMNHIAEAVRQLRHEAGPVQIEGARHIAVTGWGDWGDGSMAIFRSPVRSGQR
jgi:acetyl-CoA acetyltransferase